MRVLSVYLSMFEQTLLTHPASARKTGALAASFMAQSAVLGVLLVGPLLYTQALPMVPPVLADVFTPPKAPQPPTSVVAEQSRVASERSLSRPFPITSVPTRVPTSRAVADLAFEPVMDASVVVSTGIPGVDLGPGISTAVLTPAPRVEVVKTVSVPKPVPIEDVKPVRVSGGVLAAKILKRVTPAYPLLAKQTRVSGTVHLQATLSKDGRIENLRVIDGHPLLRQAALDAVSQWVYSPTILNGVPVEVEAPIEVNFTLN